MAAAACSLAGLVLAACLARRPRRRAS